jgi:hypothetical protein
MTSRCGAARQRAAKPCGERVRVPDCKRACTGSRPHLQRSIAAILVRTSPAAAADSRSFRSAGSRRCWKYAGKMSKVTAMLLRLAQVLR